MVEYEDLVDRIAKLEKENGDLKKQNAELKKGNTRLRATSRQSRTTTITTAWWTSVSPPASATRKSFMRPTRASQLREAARSPGSSTDPDFWDGRADRDVSPVNKRRGGQSKQFEGKLVNGNTTGSPKPSYMQPTTASDKKRESQVPPAAMTQTQPGIRLNFQKSRTAKTTQSTGRKVARASAELVKIGDTPKEAPQSEHQPSTIRPASRTGSTTLGGTPESPSSTSDP